MLAGLRLQVEALEALGQTSAGGVDPRRARMRATVVPLQTDLTRTPTIRIGGVPSGGKGESEVSLDDKRTYCRGNSKQR